MQKTYLYTGIAAGVLLLLFILWGPSESEEQQRDSILWLENWEVIEYYPGAPAEDADPQAAAESAAFQIADTPSIRFIREPGLLGDEYFVEAPPANSDLTRIPEAKAGAFIRRRGGATVSNLFRDWRRPKLSGYAELSAEREAEFRLDQPEHVLKFYASPGADPIILRGGKKTGGANRMAASNYGDHSELLLIVGSYLFDRFIQDPFTFREKRVLVYPANSFTNSISIVNAEGETLHLTQRRTERPDGGPLMQFRREAADGRPAVDLPLNLASPVDGAVKSLMIQNFRDEPLLARYGDPQQLWDAAGKHTARIEIGIEDGEEYWIELREVPAATDDDLVLMRASSTIDQGVDWARRSAMENLLKHVPALRGYEPPKKQPESPDAGPGSSGSQSGIPFQSAATEPE